MKLFTTLFYSGFHIHSDNEKLHLHKPMSQPAWLQIKGPFLQILCFRKASGNASRHTGMPVWATVPGAGSG